MFEERHSLLLSTRNNNRSIDHILVTPGILKTIKKAGLVPQAIGFSTSDHCGLFLDVSPSILETNTTPLQPPSHRKLRLHNAPKVEWYILQVLEKADDQNITKRLIRLRGH